MKKSLLKLVPVLSLALLYPFVASAQSGDPCFAVTGVLHIMCKLQQLLNAVLPVLITLGVIYFVWGVVQYVIGGSEEDKKTGRDKMLWGVIGLAVIISLWGLVYILVDTFGLEAPAPSHIEINGLLPR